MRLRGARQAIEPSQRLLDLVRFETDRGELAGELVVLRAGVGLLLTETKDLKTTLNIFSENF